MKFTKQDGLKSLAIDRTETTFTKNHQFRVAGDPNDDEGEYEITEWDVDPLGAIPTDAEIIAETARLQAEYDGNEYQRKRSWKYPEIGEQLDLLWHAIDDEKLNKTSGFYTQLKAVKDRYSKP